ncbi:MAG: hypothetical protein SWH61_09870 [Thermodesulfobacteriota bacterium]|nr:hypothetical protein [Thermodesulfobacteriota bacterium]
MRVKGTVILDLVRIIRAEKDKNWEPYMEPEDWEIINSTIMASKWYPGDAFWRISYAVAKEVGRMTPENLFAFGRLSATSYLKLYSRLVIPDDPAGTIERCINSWHLFYDFEGSTAKRNELEKGPNHVTIKAYDYPDMLMPEMRYPYFYGLAGYYQEMAETALKGKEIRNTFTDKGDYYEITYEWD